MGKLLTASEFGRLPSSDQPQELIAGRVVERPVRFPFYGLVCSNVARSLAGHVEANDLGRVVLRSGVITTFDPDTVRGVDVSFYSYSRLPRGRLPDGRYLDVRPELAVDVHDPRERWSLVLGKTAELLNAGVEVVCVIDPPTHTAIVYRDNQNPEPLAADAELTLPDVLPGFRVPLRQFFE